MKLSLTIVILLTACGMLYAGNSSADVTISFSWQYHYQVPRLDTLSMRTIRGDMFSLSTLRYYVGKIALRNTHGIAHQTQGYYLIGKEAEGEGACLISDVPAGTYNEVSFILGVDSAANVAGPREGDLDPLHGMYWTWSTGYIFFKLEGASPASLQTKNLVEYHIGGYSAPFNNIQRIVLPLRRPLVVRNGQHHALEIAFDVGQFIDADGGLDFTTTSSITDAPHAAQLASRLKGAFRVR